MEEKVYEFKAFIIAERYYSEDSSYGVFNFCTDDDIPEYIEPTYKEDVEHGSKIGTLSGRMQYLNLNCEYQIRANIRQDNKYGTQYVPISITAIVPTSKENQLLFLQSIINSKLAENLIEAYPNIVDDVINNNINQIDYSLVKGLGEKTWVKVKTAIEDNFLISDVIVMLRPLGVTYTMIRKLLEEEPNPTLLKQEIEKNPYCVNKFSGIGFKRSDEFALKINPKLIDSVERLAAFTSYFFKGIGENDGHTWCTIDTFKSNVASIVPECMEKVDWLLQNNNFLHVEQDKVGLKYYYDTEMKIYHALLGRVGTVDKVVISENMIEKAIKEAQEEQGFEYVEEQLIAIKNSLSMSVSFITGKAGTGKSSIMRAILKAHKLSGYSISACALSAMAAKRVEEASSFPASTIHRALGAKGINEFKYNKNNPLPCDLAFMDEGSMVSATLFLQWLEAIGGNTRIIIAGDYKQLPPIGYGNVFSDLIKLFDTPIVNELKKPMRQAQKSGILTDANIIRENKNPITEKLDSRLVHGEMKDMYYMFRTNRESLFNIAVKTFCKSIETDGLDNVVIITPRKDNCINSTKELNNIIQEKLLGDELIEISNSNCTFKLGAKVMQTVNDYDKNVFNGEIGYITDIDSQVNEKGHKEECCIISFDAGAKKIAYMKSELFAISLAYALTTHKCQGSGYKTVIGIIDNTHYQLLDNCMLYTMLTRAKKRCLLLAEPQAFLRCIKTSNNKRDTWLYLEEELKKGGKYT